MTAFVWKMMSFTSLATIERGNTMKKIITVAEVRALNAEIKCEWLDRLTDEQIWDSIRFGTDTARKWIDLLIDLLDAPPTPEFNPDNDTECYEPREENAWEMGDFPWDAPGMSVRDFIR